MIKISRTKQGKLLAIENNCYLRAVFEDVNGKASPIVIKPETLIDFLSEGGEHNIDYYTEECIEIKESHHKIADVYMLSRCPIENKTQEGVQKRF